MQKSKLISLLSTFTKKEWKGFLTFLVSPYCNAEPEILTLGQWLHGRQVTVNTTLSRQEVWLTLYPSFPMDDKQLNYLLSWLYQSALKFLAFERIQTDAVVFETTIASVLSQRGLDKPFAFQVDRTKRIVQQSPLRDSNYWKQYFDLSQLESWHFMQKAARKVNPYLQAGSDHLDAFYFSEKLRYACSMLNTQYLISSEFDLVFVDEIGRLLAAHPQWLLKPSIGIYYYIWKLSIHHEEDNYPDFQVLKTMISTCRSQFTNEEATVHLGYALNYCIRQIRNVKEKYIFEALQLYEEGIKTGLLMSGAFLSPWHYKNIVRLGLRSERFDWTEDFIRQKSQLLEEHFRENAFHFGLADLYFCTRKYQLALEHLQLVDWADIYNNLDAKEMLAKIYYETDADDALFGHISTFRAFLRRNKVISNEVRSAYQNFLKLLEQSIHAAPHTIAKLRETILSTEPLVSKNWLLEKLA